MLLLVPYKRRGLIMTVYKDTFTWLLNSVQVIAFDAV